MTEENITIPIRVIRSFPHRNIRNIVLKDVSTTLTTESLLDKLLAEVSSSSSLPPPFRLEMDKCKCCCVKL